MRALTFILALGFVLLATDARAFSYEEIRQLYARALAGDKGAVDQCITVLSDVLKREPNNQLARVYLGSSYTLRSRDLSIGPSKLSTLRTGLRLMDEAAAADASNVRVRLTRALTNRALPFFVGRQKSSQNELLDLAAIVQRTPEKLDGFNRQVLFLEAGRVARDRGDKARATQWWKLGLTNHADPKLTAQLRAALAQP